MYKKMLEMIHLLEDQYYESDRNFKKELTTNEMARANFQLQVKLNKERFNEIENVKIKKMEEQI
jgi:hypothetical protein